MSVPAICVITITVFCLTNVICHADEPENSIAFSEVFKSLVQERQNPQLFEVKYMLLNQYLDNEQKKDGLVELRKTDVAGSRRIETVGMIRFDEVVGKLYCEQTSRLEDVIDPSREKSWNSYVLSNHKNGFKLILPGVKYVFDADSEKLFEGPPPTNIESEIPLDLKIYGLCSTNELMIGKPFEQIASRIFSDFKNWNCRLDENGVAIIDLHNEIYRIDTKRGFWPIERKTFFFDKRNGKRVVVPLMGQDIKLIEVNGCWLPKSVFAINGNLSLSYSFDWVSHDEPLAPDVFDLKSIMKERKKMAKPPRAEKEKSP